MTTTSLSLVELFTSRLCHDLIAPIGAVNTGLELLGETSPGHSTESEEILNLILNSAQTASARVSFFRGAYGNNGEALSLGEARDLIENYFARTKLSFHWQESFQHNLVLKGWARFLLNSTLWLSECAPRGGVLQVDFPQQDLSILSLRLKADPLILHQGTLEALRGDVSFQDLTPRLIPCYFIHLLAEEKKIKIEVLQPSPTELVLEVG
jgi:histidine phosphotransferase ChpT